MKQPDLRISTNSANSQIQRGGALVRKPGFALPTVLISSMVMLMILVTAVSVTTSISSSLRDQRYTELASLAANAGTVMATACLNQNGGQATWTNAKPLRPNTDCSGDAISGQSAYVFETSDVRTYFEVGQPLLGAGNVPISAASKGYSEVLRTSSGVAWRVWSSDTSVVLAAGGDGLPVGSVIDGFWTTAPTGYLLTNGAAVSRTTYANLFAVIGTTYGAGNGSTTFNVPDTRGRVIVNRSADAEFNTLGEKYGAKTHTLTIAQMPAHDHGGQTGDTVPNHGRSTSDGGSGSTRSRSGSDSTGRYTEGLHSGNHSHTISSQGGGGAHNNIQPSIVANQAIKY